MADPSLHASKPAGGNAPGGLFGCKKAPVMWGSQGRSKEALMKSARADGERFCFQARYGKRGNTLCTRKGYAASVSLLAQATAALYFPLFIPQSGSKRSAVQPQTIYSEFPQNVRVPEVMRSPLMRSKSMTASPEMLRRIFSPSLNRVLPKTTPVSRKLPRRILMVDSMPVGMAP